MLGALYWLIENNKYYHSFTIDSDALALLPEDADISGLCAVTMDTPNEDQPIVIFLIADRNNLGFINLVKGWSNLL